MLLKRYREFEPQLDAAIKATMKLVPETYAADGVARTDTASQNLVEMEQHAVGLACQGQVSEGRTFLFSDEKVKKQEVEI